MKFKNIEFISLQEEHCIAETVIAQAISLSRNINQNNLSLHDGVWTKNFRYGREIRGTRFGIVGYDDLGVRIGILAEKFGMLVNYFHSKNVLAYGNAKKIHSLQSLINESDIICFCVKDTNYAHNTIKQNIKHLKDSRAIICCYELCAAGLKTLVNLYKEGLINGLSVNYVDNEYMRSCLIEADIYYDSNASMLPSAKVR